ncbi:Uncharacterised protein [Serratia fonticola]|jgi:hypothetical protein|uniref:Uncharacterized protein n=1 Tax=Serratia fonticola TaxID=47917 RepID=A0A3S5F1C2_SERFO|nr:Uncharacterised protein [Serratia fonticola]VEI63194.1 Uncharacterised protein [Serratia fonticola]
MRASSLLLLNNLSIGHIDISLWVMFFVIFIILMLIFRFSP